MTNYRSESDNAVLLGNSKRQMPPLTPLRSFQNSLLVCGLAGLGSAVTGYYYQGRDAAITADVAWFVGAPLVALWRYKEQTAKAK
jgi:hypothetical protein